MFTGSSRTKFAVAALAVALTPSLLRADIDDDDFDDDDDAAYAYGDHRHIDAEVRVYRQGERPTYSYEYYESRPDYSSSYRRDDGWRERDEGRYDSSRYYYDEREVAGAREQRDSTRAGPGPDGADRGTTYYYYDETDRHRGYDSRYDREPQYDRRETYYDRDWDADDDDDDVSWHRDHGTYGLDWRGAYRQDRYERYDSGWREADEARDDGGRYGTSYTDGRPRYDERREYRTDDRNASPDYRYREYSFSYSGDFDDDDFDD